MTIESHVSRADIAVRQAERDDLPRLLEIYNHYVINTPITFDLEPLTLDQRQTWFDQFADRGPHQLFVAEKQGRVVGYADTHAFRTKAAYNKTVETTVYCDIEMRGRGIGTVLYTRLLEALLGEDVKLAIAGITLPNEASLALHKRFGFEPAGVMHEVGFKFDRYWDVGWFEKKLG